MRDNNMCIQIYVLGTYLHYLPMTLRIQLLDRLVDFSNNTKFDESTNSTVNLDDDDCASVSAGLPCCDDLHHETIASWGTTGTQTNCNL